MTALLVRDANGNTQSITLGVPNVNGAPVASGNPMPVSDATAGSTADAAWTGSGSGSLVALLKALWTQLNAPLLTHPGTITITMTVVSLSQTDTQIVAANASRRYLALVNINTGLATLNFGSAATAGQGWPLSAAGAAGDQGGALIFESSAITQQAIHGICASGVTTSVVVLEGV